MSPTNPVGTTRLGVLAVVLAVALSALAPAAAIPQPDGTIGLEQTTDVGTVAPGGSVTVEATINATGYNAPAMAVDLPDGWSIASQSAEGPATYKSSTNEWVWLSGGEYTVTYTVAVPGDADEGEFTVSNEGSAVDPADGSFVENSAETTVTVQTQPENQPPNADAGTDKTVDEGTSVSLDASGSSDPDGDELSYSWTVTDDAGTGVTLADADTATPTFTAPDVPGDETLTFEVQVSDGQASDTASVDVTVQDTDGDQPAGPSVTVTQSAQSTSVAPGGTVSVETTISATGVNAPALDVTLPDGWSIPSQSADGPATYKPDTNEWVWLSGGEYTVSYTVAVPGDATEDDYTITADGSAVDPATDEFLTDSAETTIAVSTDDDPEPEPAGPSTAVSLAPSSAAAVSGTTQTFDVVVESADGGVGAFSVSVSVEDDGVGTITDAAVHESASPATSDASIAADGSSVSLDAALLDTADTGSTTVATVTVAADSEGTTDLDLSVSALGTEMGQNYEVTGTDGATLTVVELGPVGNFAAPPTDTDVDGSHEDINGDGEFDIVDVQALFANLDDPTIQTSPDSFDFNDDGSADIVDVQALYTELTS